MIIERALCVLLPERQMAFLALDKDDPMVDALECDGYTVYTVELMTVQISQGFFNLTVYAEKSRKSYFGNDKIEVETHTLLIQAERPLDISEPL